MATNLPAPFIARAATKDDAATLGRLFFTSFYPSHAYWRTIFPNNTVFNSWMEEVFRIGIQDDPGARTFVVIDPENTSDESQPAGKMVAFSRWIVPQKDGNLVKVWPELPTEMDMELAGPFFVGMEENRNELMGSSPHWMLELLGTDQDYWGKGIGPALVRWGCDLADEEGLAVYLDASSRGLPVYQKHFNFEPKKRILVPHRPEVYPEFVYISAVRPIQGT